MTQRMNKTIVSRAIISKIEIENHPKEVRTKHVMGYETPNKILVQGNDEGYVPDIAAFYDDETVVYEIELNKAMPIEKWKSLSMYARKNHGRFYLVVPDYLKEEIKAEMKENEVNAGLIYFNTERSN